MHDKMSILCKLYAWPDNLHISLMLSYTYTCITAQYTQLVNSGVGIMRIHGPMQMQTSRIL